MQSEKTASWFFLICSICKIHGIPGISYLIVVVVKHGRSQNTCSILPLYEIYIGKNETFPIKVGFKKNKNSWNFIINDKWDLYGYYLYFSRKKMEGGSPLKYWSNYNLMHFYEFATNRNSIGQKRCASAPARASAHPYLVMQNILPAMHKIQIW